MHNNYCQAVLMPKDTSCKSGTFYYKKILSQSRYEVITEVKRPLEKIVKHSAIALWFTCVHLMLLNSVVQVTPCMYNRKIVGCMQRSLSFPVEADLCRLGH